MAAQWRMDSGIRMTRKEPAVIGQVSGVVRKWWPSRWEKWLDPGLIFFLSRANQTF